MKTRLVLNARGGIGNQLFIAAAAIHLSAQLQCRTYVSLLDIDYSHSASGATLKKFGFSRNLFLDSNPLLNLLVFVSKKKLLRRHFYPVISRFIIEFHDVGNRSLNVESLKKLIQRYPHWRIIYVNGFFQDFSYASEIMKKKNQIFNQLVKPSLHPVEKNYVAVHVRLGDMLEHKKSFGVLSQNYYTKAVNRIAHEELPKIKLISDDYAAAKMMLSRCLENIDEEPNETLYQEPSRDFYSIANATYIVTSNSTFSMWAAFVSQTAKEVVVPKTFRYDGLSEIGSLPNSWDRIDSSWLN